MQLGARHFEGFLRQDGARLPLQLAHGAVFARNILTFWISLLPKERSSLENDMNEVPLAVAAFFRSPTVVWLHSGFVWHLARHPNSSLAPGPCGRSSAAMPRRCDCGGKSFVTCSGGARGRPFNLLCARKLRPHWDFEICEGSAFDKTSRDWNEISS